MSIPGGTQRQLLRLLVLVTLLAGSFALYRAHERAFWARFERTLRPRVESLGREWVDLHSLSSLNKMPHHTARVQSVNTNQDEILVYLRRKDRSIVAVRAFLTNQIESATLRRMVPGRTYSFPMELRTDPVEGGDQK